MPDLEELYEGLSEKLYRYILKLSGDEHVAEEILQETFYRAFEHIIVNKSELKESWFFVVARNLFFDKASRISTDYIQFSKPVAVNGYGNNWLELGDYSLDYYVYASNIIGTKQEQSYDYKWELNLLNGKMKSTIYPNSAPFIHPDIQPMDMYIENNNIDIAKKILKKNKDNTVADINITLKNIINLEDAVELLRNHDIRIVWMAVEGGTETNKPKNMNYDTVQCNTWGIPGKFINTKSFSFTEITYDNYEEYKEIILDELKWMDENKDIIQCDKTLLNTNGIDNSIGDRASYVLNNGIKIYGLKLTGPSNELYNVLDDLDARFAKVENIDFWYWK